MVDAELLDAIGSELGDPSLSFAEPPTVLSGGFFTENHRFQLRSAPPPWER